MANLRVLIYTNITKKQVVPETPHIREVMWKSHPRDSEHRRKDLRWSVTASSPMVISVEVEKFEEIRSIGFGYHVPNPRCITPKQQWPWMPE
jgi:hypothetical protein